MFNLHPNHTVHVDYCEYGGRDYIVVVDRVTGYIKAEQTPNQGTDADAYVIWISNACNIGFRWWF